MGIVNDLVDKVQYQLRLELERRKHMLKFDAKDHQLVETFYQLQPRKTEVRSKQSFTFLSYTVLKGTPPLFFMVFRSRKR